MKTILRIVAALGMFAILALCLNPPWRGNATGVEGKKTHPRDFIKMKNVNVQEMYVGHKSLFAPPEYVHYLMSRSQPSRRRSLSYMGKTPIFGDARIDTGRLIAELFAIAAVTGMIVLVLSVCTVVERADPQE